MKNAGETAHAKALMQENLADFKLTYLAGIWKQAEWDRGGGEKGRGREVREEGVEEVVEGRKGEGDVKEINKCQFL